MPAQPDQLLGALLNQLVRALKQIEAPSQSPAGESGAHAGRDKKQSNLTRKIFAVRVTAIFPTTRLYTLFRPLG